MAYAGIDGKVTLYIATPIAADKKYWKLSLPFKSESINPKYRTVVASESVAGKRGKLGQFINGRAYEGSIELDLFDLTNSGTTPRTVHGLLGLMFYAALGNYASNKVSLGTTAPRLAFVVIDHGDTSNGIIYYKNAYLSGFSCRLPADGVPSITLDVRAESYGEGEPTLETDWTAVDIKGSLEYSSFYRPSDYTIELNTTNMTSLVTNIELSTSMDVLEGSAGYGNPVDLPIAPALMDSWDINLEFNVNKLTTLNDWAELQAALTGGKASTLDITVTLKSPMDDTKSAVMTITKPFVTEFNHDMSASDFLRGKLVLKAPADGIELTGITLPTT